MADNIAITPGSGATVATDDAGAGGHVQIIKQAISTDGSATPIPADTTNGLDVDVTRLPYDVAHDAADSGNPIKTGGKAVSSLATTTLVANGDRTNFNTDLDGSQIVRLNYPLGDLIHERVTDTGGTSTAFTNFGAVASTKSVVTSIAVYNSSATAGFVDFRDGTGGSVLWTMPLPAGGGAVMGDPSGLFRTSANTALAYDVSAALSTVYISVSGFKSKI